MMFTLPKPNDAFRWVQLPVDSAQGRPALVCEALSPFASHFFTTRAWRLGEASATEPGWLEVAETAGVGLRHLGRLRQVHGADAILLRKSTDPESGGSRDAGEDMGEADILMTDDPTRAVAVKAADCLPILVVDRRTRVVAAAHAGWRGLASRVPIITVERLRMEFGSDERDLLVAIGPAIGACCYEVGEDVRARFAGFEAADVERWFAANPSMWARNPSAPMLTSRRSGHWFFDGWRCVSDQLVSAGVPSAQIYVAELCTASHGAAFCSYRRDGVVAGRMVGVIRPRN